MYQDVPWKSWRCWPPLLPVVDCSICWWLGQRRNPALHYNCYALLPTSNCDLECDCHQPVGKMNSVGQLRCLVPSWIVRWSVHRFNFRNLSLYSKSFKVLWNGAELSLGEAYPSCSADSIPVNSIQNEVGPNFYTVAPSDLESCTWLSFLSTQFRHTLFYEANFRYSNLCRCTGFQLRFASWVV